MVVVQGIAILLPQPAGGTYCVKEPQLDPAKGPHILGRQGPFF